MKLLYVSTKVETMTRVQSPLNRFFVSSEFSVHYRKTKGLDWRNSTTSGYALLSVLSGTVDCSTAEERFVLEPGESRIIEPNVVLSATGKQVEFLYFSISPSLVIQHAISMHLVPPKSMVSFSTDPIRANSRLQSLLKSFVAELVAENAGKEIFMRALIQQLVVQLLREFARPRFSDELELSRVGLIDRRIRKSVELMHTQLDQELSLKSLAAASYLSTFHFARLFKKITGSTPHNYLAGIRTNRAQLLLAETDLSITEIGARVGYLSASHFTKAFRLATGTTPREFRKALVKRD